MAKKKLDLSALAQLRDVLPVGEVEPDISQVLEYPCLYRSPLQELKCTAFRKEGKNELPDPIFERAIEAEQSAAPLYDYLSQRIESIADKTLKITFPWRLRVGGLPGFRELLLPAMHTVYGVPYVPASSLKGVVREWAEQQDEAIRGQVRSMLGYLDMNAKEDASSLGKIQFLDAFPTGKCLSIDMANPQWHWPKKRGADGSFAVTYNPEPHALLSLQGATLTIGIKATRLGSEKDVEVMEKWVREALKHGLGSRISAGYGRARGQIAETQLSCEYPFQLWSQGMYGSTPPMKTNGYKGEVEFRPSAVRGILRYWFRAIALGLYDADTVKILEGKLFGTIQPAAVRGSLSISIDNEENGREPFRISGKIRLMAESEVHLKFAQMLLTLAFNLSGVGRGSRRPLHWNTDQLRGCHWELSDAPIVMNSAIWQQMLENARSALRTVQQGYGELSPKEAKICRLEKRTQDVLNESAHIYLLKCGGMKHPKAVKDEEWRKIGDTYQVRGEGLQLLYSSGNYKGRSSDRDGLKPGNPNVGGAVNQEDGSIPSYVLIKSIIPHTGDPYQVITIFDVDGHDDRATFANAIKDKGGMKVWPPAP
jgi:CRISPR-associated protein Cmr6